MESVWSVSKLSTESVGSRCELVANCVHTADADATKQFRRDGGVYWALVDETCDEGMDSFECARQASFCTDK